MLIPLAASAVPARAAAADDYPLIVPAVPADYAYPADLEEQTRHKIYTINSACCSADDFPQSVIDKLEEYDKRLPLQLDSPTPMSRARAETLGRDGSQSNDNRHMLCGHDNLQSFYRIRLESIFKDADLPPTSAVAKWDSNPKKRQAAIRESWNRRLNGYCVTLKQWLPPNFC
ncbi:hypothetical protein ACW9HQ_46215 [Nocardia gipuzkoensis]